MCLTLFLTQRHMGQDIPPSVIFKFDHLVKVVNAGTLHGRFLFFPLQFRVIL